MAVMSAVGRGGNPRRRARPVRPVEPDDRVEVDQPPRLELRDLRVADAEAVAQFVLRQPCLAGQHSSEIDDEPAPELGCVPVPEHRALVVVDVGIKRRAEERVVRGMHDAAAAGAPVVPAGVNGAERRSGERHEGLGVRTNGLGDALSPAGQARVDELPHVAAVLVGARRTAGLTTIPAAHHEDTVGLVGRRVGESAAAHHPTAEPDRPAASSGPLDLLEPPLAARIRDSCDEARDRGRVRE